MESAVSAGYSRGVTYLGPVFTGRKVELPPVPTYLVMPLRNVTCARGSFFSFASLSFLGEIPKKIFSSKPNLACLLHNPTSSR